MFVPPIELRIRDLTYAITAMSGAIIQLAGGRVGVAGNVMAGPRAGFTMRVMEGCNGVEVVVLLWSAMLAWPAGRVAKIKGMVLGALIVQAANTLRIISLFYLGQWNQNWFEWMHLYVWQILIMILGLAVFSVWIRGTPEIATPGPAK